jgi:uncharacterized protein YbbK (DUF523 family)
MKMILVSGCLYGWHCRYDGVDLPSTDKRFLDWKEKGILIPVCPEVFGGLDTPRPDCQRIGNKIISCTGIDSTKEYDKGVLEALRLAKENNVICCIMKQDSPSCGSKYIYDGTFTDTKKEGVGITVEILKENGFKVFDEDELDEVEKLLNE